PPDMIDRHDLSKLSLVTSLAYTLQNIDKVCHTPSRQFKEKHINDSKIYPLTIDGIKQQMSISWLYLSFLNLMAYRYDHKYYGILIYKVSLRDLTNFSKNRFKNYTETDKKICLQIINDIKNKNMENSLLNCLSLCW
ncbi:hypothetical protein TCON_2692, partial [Astathelohania contejeani]